MKLLLSTLGLAALVAGCSSGNNTGSATSNLVTAAAAAAEATHAGTKACFTDFQTCIESASTEDAVAACQATLASCLPAPASVGADGVPDLCNTSASPAGGGGGGGGDCKGSGDGGMAPPDGGAGSRAPGGGDHDRARRLPVSEAGRIALATCHAELGKCLDGDTAAATCTATAHTCVHDALLADFTALCTAVSQQCASCSTAQLCVDLTKRCADGLTFPDSGGSAATSN
jgi:hypothetical protein